MAAALGLSESQAGRHITTVDAQNWADFPRRRMKLSTLPRGPLIWRPDRRDACWGATGGRARKAECSR
eukprot:5803311-Lingulodinium_polyedra.AAC.1